MIISEVKTVDEQVWYLLQSKVKQKQIVEVFRTFREMQVEPILIKGWAVSRYYPSGKIRFFSDIDLCVAPSMYEKAQRILDSEKLKLFNVDLHCGLRHLDTVEWENLFENSIFIEVENEIIRVLRPEDHLRILCVHWLTDGGADLERLYDIFYLFESERENFDWERCLNIVAENRRRWVLGTISIAEKYLPVSFAGENFNFSENEKKVSEWVYKELEREWQSGYPLKPLRICLKDKRELWKQIKKRLPPNALGAMIDVEGRIDSKYKIFYQFSSICLRMFPALKRIKTVLFADVK